MVKPNLQTTGANRMAYAIFSETTPGHNVEVLFWRVSDDGQRAVGYGIDGGQCVNLEAVEGFKFYSYSKEVQQ